MARTRLLLCHVTVFDLFDLPLLTARRMTGEDRWGHMPADRCWQFSNELWGFESVKHKYGLRSLFVQSFFFLCIPSDSTDYPCAIFHICCAAVYCLLAGFVYLSVLVSSHYTNTTCARPLTTDLIWTSFQSVLQLSDQCYDQVIFTMLDRHFEEMTIRADDRQRSQ